MAVLRQIAAGEDPAHSREAQLVSAVLCKDRKATAEFVSLCSDWIYPFVSYRLLPRADMVEDVMQEILISAWKDLPNFRREAGLRGWILGIARHKVEDYYRKRIREVALQDEDSIIEEETFASTNVLDVDGSDHERVHRTLMQLPETYRLALIWKYRDGRSLREMGELTSKTEKAMERLLARARESFKKRWNDG
jgi:RNA polymerase sigma-70 factor, ECF subfamily